MPTPNIYHPSGRLYTQFEFDARSAAQVPLYTVLGYVNPKRSFKWYGEQSVRPYTPGRNKLKRQAAFEGFKSWRQMLKG